MLCFWLFCNTCTLSTSCWPKELFSKKTFLCSCTHGLIDQIQRACSRLFNNAREQLPTLMGMLGILIALQVILLLLRPSSESQGRMQVSPELKCWTYRALKMRMRGQRLWKDALKRTERKRRGSKRLRRKLIKKSGRSYIGHSRSPPKRARVRWTPPRARRWESRCCDSHKWIWFTCSNIFKRNKTRFVLRTVESNFYTYIGGEQRISNWRDHPQRLNGGHPWGWHGEIHPFLHRCKNIHD